MSEQNQTYLAKGLDDPIPIFFFDPVDFVLITTFFGIGVVMKEMLVGIFLAWGVMKLSKIMRKGAKRGVMAHTLWRLGLMGDKHLTRYDPIKTDFIN